MKVHEFQAKALFREAGIPVPASDVAQDPAQAAAIYTRLGTPLAAVKAQIHAGGRGKAGGVKLGRSAAEASAAAQALLGKPLVTIQTGPKGQVVKRVLVEAGTDIAHEYYAAITVDRSRGAPVLMVSAEGGMDIEEVARRTPERILRETLDAEAGLRPWQARRLAYALGLPAGSITPAIDLLRRLGRMFLDLDASLVEVNPLVLRKDGQLVALDGKIDFDSNALYRHPQIAALRDRDEEDPRELAAAEAGLAYIALDGNIGCLVNGAGLAMGTMDTIQLAGGEPANFLDVGGGATKEQVTAAFRIIRSDARVQAILVNIFGGIMKCDVIAEGILAALRATGPGVPLVVRLEGTHVEKGRALLEESGLPLITATDLADAASKAVAAAHATAGPAAAGPATGAAR